MDKYYCERSYIKCESIRNFCSPTTEHYAGRVDLYVLVVVVFLVSMVIILMEAWYLDTDY